MAGTVGWPPLATDVLGLHGTSLPTVRTGGHSVLAGLFLAYVRAGNAKRLVELLCDWQATVGHGVNYQVYFFGRRVVHLVDPVDVRHVQVRVNPPRDGPTMRHFGTPITPDVLVLLDDRRHAAARRLVGPFLLGPRTTDAVLRVVNDQLGPTGSWTRRLDALASGGEVCDVDSLLVDFTLGVIHEVLFSEPWVGADAHGRARAALTDFFRLQYLSFVPAPGLFSPRSVAALRAAGDFFVNYVGAMEARRRAAYADGSRARAPAADLFDILLADLDSSGGVYESPRRVAADVMIFLAGGFDSTAHSISWALHELLLNPPVEACVREELRSCSLTADTPLTADHDGRLPYLTAVWNETLRKYPTVPLGSLRCLSTDVTLPSNGSVLPAGTAVAIAPYPVLHDPARFPAPHEFMPTRYLGTSPSLAASAGSTAHPAFGAGGRNCPGQQLGAVEWKAVMVRLLTRYRVARAGGQVTKETAFTMRPAGLRVTLSRV